MMDIFNSFIQKTITFNDCQIHYWLTQNTAKRPWLIFLHGAGADHNMFNDQLPSLIEHYNILLWDARGHGLSRPLGKDFSIRILVDDLSAIMQEENIVRATFIGQSMGGNTAQEMAFLHPKKVENLVLIDCACNTMKLSGLEKFLIRLTPILLPLYPWTYMVNQSARVSSIRPEVQDYLKEVFNIVGSKDFDRIFLATADCLHYEPSYVVNKPILLVCGEFDNTGNIKKIAPIWASQEPKCEFHVINKASHCSNQDNPADFNSIIISFLDKQYVHK